MMLSSDKRSCSNHQSRNSVTSTHNCIHQCVITHNADKSIQKVTSFVTVLNELLKVINNEYCILSVTKLTNKFQNMNLCWMSAFFIVTSFMKISCSLSKRTMSFLLISILQSDWIIVQYLKCQARSIWRCLWWLMHSKMSIIISCMIWSHSSEFYSESVFIEMNLVERDE